MESNKGFFRGSCVWTQWPTQVSFDHWPVHTFTPTKKISNSSIDTDVGFGKSREPNDQPEVHLPTSDFQETFVSWDKGLLESALIIEAVQPTKSKMSNEKKPSLLSSVTYWLFNRNPYIYIFAHIYIYNGLWDNPYYSLYGCFQQ